MLACRLVSCASDLKLASQAKGHLDLAVDEGQYSSSAVAALEALIEDVSCHHNAVVSVVMTSILVQSQGQVPYGCDVDYGDQYTTFSHIVRICSFDSIQCLSECPTMLMSRNLVWTVDPDSKSIDIAREVEKQIREMDPFMNPHSFLALQDYAETDPDSIRTLINNWIVGEKCYSRTVQEQFVDLTRDCGLPYSIDLFERSDAALGLLRALILNRARNYIVEKARTTEEALHQSLAEFPPRFKIMIGFKISKWKRARSELESENGQSRAHEHVRSFRTRS